MRSKLTITGANLPKFGPLTPGQCFLSQSPHDTGCLYMKISSVLPTDGGYNAVCIYSDNSQDSDRVGDRRLFSQDTPIIQIHIDEIKGTAQ